MKKLIFTFTILLFISCSSSDSEDNSSKSDFNPPSWIQGTWKQQTDLSTGVGFKFSSNDFCSTISSTQQCQKGLVDLARSGGIIVKVTETISDKYYSVEISYSVGQTITYSFKKNSATKIQWTEVPDAIFLKQ
ncbi:hypothetical protein [Flavobacterium sp. 140616W15]|uniref:hypothetical protein n=1 Tax=Flavobacterium sp. 140616W15 TaxID=2478552 RepID=UPI000F0C900A|nr:hypothetical protein [Flavobacterium sp. 140616W15]AYN05484.1 hypothetical protein EAG11_16000 [Flavobacterium sp. 140616W15]